MAEPVIVGRNPFIAPGIGGGLLAPRKLGGAIKGCALRATHYRAAQAAERCHLEGSSAGLLGN